MLLVADGAAGGLDAAGGINTGGGRCGGLKTDDANSFALLLAKAASRLIAALRRCSSERIDDICDGCSDGCGDGCGDGSGDGCGDDCGDGVGCLPASSWCH